MDYQVEYLQPQGPVAAAFMNSTAPVNLIAGPNGSGKTTLALYTKMMYHAALQQPNDKGIRLTRWGIVRDTYPNLWDKTIKSFKKMVDFESSWAKFSGIKGRQADLEIKYEMADGTIVHTEFMFRAIGDNNIEAAVGGFEPTGWGLDEIADLPEELLEFCLGRVGRFPSTKIENGEFLYGPTWAGINSAFNKPGKLHWLYDYCIKNPRDGICFFSQPGGLERCHGTDKNAFPAHGEYYRVNRKAENLNNLPPSYYELAFKAGRMSWGKRFILNEWGDDLSGRPVYPEYNDQFHCLEVYDVNPLRPIILGADAGRGHPAVVFAQQNDYGQIIIFDEYESENVGATRFGNALAQYIKQKYSDNYIECLWVDPAGGAAGHDVEEMSWMQIIGKALDCVARPAPLTSNKPDLRIEAVSWGLTNTVDNFKPLLVVTKNCTRIRAGFISDYKFAKLQNHNGTSDLYDAQPLKNEFSHIHDAVQYLCLGVGFLKRVQGRNRKLRPVIAKGKSYGLR